MAGGDARPTTEGKSEKRVFERSAVLQVGRDPVAGKVWQQVEGKAPAVARRLVMRSTS